MTAPVTDVFLSIPVPSPGAQKLLSAEHARHQLRAIFRDSEILTVTHETTKASPTQQRVKVSFVGIVPLQEMLEVSSKTFNPTLFTTLKTLFAQRDGASEKKKYGRDDSALVEWVSDEALGLLKEEKSFCLKENRKLKQKSELPTLQCAQAKAAAAKDEVTLLFKATVQQALQKCRAARHALKDLELERPFSSVREGVSKFTTLAGELVANVTALTQIVSAGNNTAHATSIANAATRTQQLCRVVSRELQEAQGEITAKIMREFPHYEESKRTRTMIVRNIFQNYVANFWDNIEQKSDRATLYARKCIERWGISRKELRASFEALALLMGHDSNPNDMAFKAFQSYFREKFEEGVKRVAETRHDHLTPLAVDWSREQWYNHLHRIHGWRFQAAHQAWNTLVQHNPDLNAISLVTVGRFLHFVCRELPSNTLSVNDSRPFQRLWDDAQLQAGPKLPFIHACNFAKFLFRTLMNEPHTSKSVVFTRVGEVDQRAAVNDLMSDLFEINSHVGAGMQSVNSDGMQRYTEKVEERVRSETGAVTYKAKATMAAHAQSCAKIIAPESTVETINSTAQTPTHTAATTPSRWLTAKNIFHRALYFGSLMLSRL